MIEAIQSALAIGGLLLVLLAMFEARRYKPTLSEQAKGEIRTRALRKAVPGLLMFAATVLLGLAS